MKPNMLMLPTLVPQRHLTSNAWCTTTEKPDLESFQVVVGDGAECPSSQDKTREDGKNTQVQEDIAFPAMMKIGTSTPPGDTAVFLDTAALSHMVTAESRLCQHVVNTSLQCAHQRSATSKGTLAFLLQNERGELVAINLQVLIVPDLGASTFLGRSAPRKGSGARPIVCPSCSTPWKPRVSDFNGSSTDVCRPYSTGYARD